MGRKAQGVPRSYTVTKFMPNVQWLEYFNTRAFNCKLCDFQFNINHIFSEFFIISFKSIFLEIFIMKCFKYKKLRTMITTPLLQQDIKNKNNEIDRRTT